MRSMSRKFTMAIAAILLAVLPSLASCEPTDGPELPGMETPATEPDSGGNENNDNDTEMETDKEITMRVGSAEFTVVLHDNATARGFAAMLPLTIDMHELNGNEKYHNLSRSLPTDSYRPGRVEAGDLMLFGSDCVVLFYETFTTGYSYTRIGRVSDPSGLSKAVGRGSVTVTFEPRS